MLSTDQVSVSEIVSLLENKILFSQQKTTLNLSFSVEINSASACPVACAGFTAAG